MHTHIIYLQIYLHIYIYIYINFHFLLFYRYRCIIIYLQLHIFIYIHKMHIFTIYTPFTHKFNMSANMSPKLDGSTSWKLTSSLWAKAIPPKGPRSPANWPPRPSAWLTSGRGRFGLLFGGWKGSTIHHQENLVENNQCMWGWTPMGFLWFVPSSAFQNPSSLCY